MEKLVSRFLNTIFPPNQNSSARAILSSQSQVDAAPMRSVARVNTNNRKECLSVCVCERDEICRSIAFWSALRIRRMSRLQCSVATIHI